MTEQLPDDVIARLTAMGPTITPDLVQDSWALLTPFHEKVGHTAPRIDRDLAYGEHDRHRLDVHTSGAEVGQQRPVVLFVHGGGFTGGDKHVPGTPMYDHIGAWAVRNGWVGVTMTYRLAPEHPWPAGAQDVAAAAHPPNRGGADRGAHHRDGDAGSQSVPARKNRILTNKGDFTSRLRGVEPKDTAKIAEPGIDVKRPAVRGR